MSLLTNPSYLSPPLTVFIISLILIALVWRWAPRNLSTKLFLAILFSTGLWSSLIFGMRASPDIHQALLWEKATPVLFYATFVFYYHFALVYTNNKKQRGILLAAYITILLAIVISPTDLIVKSMRIEDYGYAPDLGYVGLIMGIATLLLMVGGGLNLIKRYKTTSASDERNRIVYLIIALTFPILGAFLDGFSNLPPMAIWTNLIFCILCTIAILKYHLLDIRIVIRKSLAYLIVSVIIAAPYVSLLYFFRFFSREVPEPWWMHPIVLIFLAIILRPTYNWAQYFVDKLFYRERYDHLESLIRFSREAHSIIDLNELSSGMVRLIQEAFRCLNVCLLLPSMDKHGFITVSCIGLENPGDGFVMQENSSLLRYFESNGAPLTSEELGNIAVYSSLSSKEKNSLEKLKVYLYVPIMSSKSELAGIIALGEKRGQNAYSNEDKEVLKTIANQMSIVLENARLYDFEKSMRQQLEIQDILKTEFLHSVAHELKTPLTSILSSSELLTGNKSIDPKLKKRLAVNVQKSALSMNRRVAELLNLARMQIGRLDIKLELLKIRKLITDVAAQMDIIFDNKKQTLIVKAPSSLPKVYGDREKLEQVLFNLLSNASKFSPSGSEITLTARKLERKVIIEVEDSASPIIAREKDLIFNPYYRSEDLEKRERFSGLGLGLSISKKIIELHNGKIWVAPKPGKGNVFGFSLAIY